MAVRRTCSSFVHLIIKRSHVPQRYLDPDGLLQLGVKLKTDCRRIRWSGERCPMNPSTRQSSQKSQRPRWRRSVKSGPSNAPAEERKHHLQVRHQNSIRRHNPWKWPKTWNSSWLHFDYLVVTDCADWSCASVLPLTGSWASHCGWCIGGGRAKRVRGGLTGSFIHTERRLMKRQRSEIRWHSQK